MDVFFRDEDDPEVRRFQLFRDLSRPPRALGNVLGRNVRLDCLDHVEKPPVEGESYLVACGTGPA